MPAVNLNVCGIVSHVNSPMEHVQNVLQADMVLTAVRTVVLTALIRI